MSALRSPEWNDAKRTRWLGEHAGLPAHVETRVRRIILAELRALGLLTDLEMFLLHDRAHAARWKLQYKQHQREQIADYNADDPVSRRQALEARLARVEAELAALRVSQADRSPPTLRRSPASGLRSLLRRLAGGR